MANIATKGPSADVTRLMREITKTRADEAARATPGYRQYYDEQMGFLGALNKASINRDRLNQLHPIGSQNIEDRRWMPSQGPIRQLGHDDTMGVAPAAPIISGSGSDNIMRGAAGDGANIATHPYQPAASFITSSGRVTLDPRLQDIIQTAAGQFPYRVEPFSGVSPRGTGTKNHPLGWAIDVNIYDQNGNLVPHYAGRALSIDQVKASPYGQFAALARQVQQQKYPELDSRFRAGAFFKSGVNPGDLMHFDISGGMLKGEPPQTQDWASLGVPDTSVAQAPTDGTRPIMYGMQGQVSKYAGMGLSEADISAAMKANAEARGYDYVEVPVSGDDKKGQQAWVTDHIKPGDGVAGFSAGGYVARDLARDLPQGTLSAAVVVGAPGVTAGDFSGIQASIDPTHSLQALQAIAPQTSGAAVQQSASLKGVTPQTLARMTGVVLAEARGEGPDGMAGVAAVIKNRALQAGGDLADGLKSKLGPIAPPMVGGYSAAEFQQAQQIVKGVVDGSIPDKTKGALYFANPDLSDPRLLKQITDVAQPFTTIGKTTFYGIPGQTPAAVAAASPALAAAYAEPDQAHLNEEWNKIVSGVVGGGQDAVTQLQHLGVGPWDNRAPVGGDITPATVAPNIATVPYQPRFSLGYTEADKSAIAGGLGYERPASTREGDPFSGQFFPSFTEPSNAGAGKMPQIYGSEGATLPSIDWSSGVQRIRGGAGDDPTASISPPPAEQPSRQPVVHQFDLSPTKDPLQSVNDYARYSSGATTPSMATTAPPTVKPDGGPGLDESMSYAMGNIIGSPTNMPTVAPAAAPALSYVPQKVAAPSVAPAPTRNIATVGPTQKPTMLNRVFGMPGMQTYNDASSVAQSVIAAAHAAGLGVSPFTPSGAGWHAPNFSSGSGGANFAYKPNGQGGGTYVNSYGQTMTY